MPYKDKSKAREAAKERMRRKRENIEGEHVTPEGEHNAKMLRPDVTPKRDKWMEDKKPEVRLIKWNVPGPMPEGSEWCAGDVVDRGLVGFQGMLLSGLNPEDEVVIGQRVFKVRELRWWMLQGVLVRDVGDLAGNRRMRMEAENKRRRFRELMYQHDIRYGARDSEGDLIARAGI